MPPLKVSTLGEFLREQRKNAQLSLRQLAEQAGVSNPYLSQIERGVRKPSADILQQIAKGLRISAEQLYVHAGILDERAEGDLAVETAVLADVAINERQKRVLLEIYRSFRAENAAEAADRTVSGPEDAWTAGPVTDPATQPPVRPRARRKSAAAEVADEPGQPEPRPTETESGEL
jgi:transcriptional regulator with XRE-family HTH domain